MKLNDEFLLQQKKKPMTFRHNFLGICIFHGIFEEFSCKLIISIVLKVYAFI